MEVLAGLVSIAVAGLVVGGLARLAVPGPDPLALWQTIALGVAGSVVGGYVAALAGVDPNDPGSVATLVLAAVAGATVLLILYRRVVQKRGITGPEARRDPRRPAAPLAGNAVLVELAELVRRRDAGEVTPADFERRKAELVARL